MSQITRCPACGTTFKVVADQLRISEGWVRCGQCKEVFDASANLLPGPARPAELLPPMALPGNAPAPVPAPAAAAPVSGPAAPSAPMTQVQHAPAPRPAGPDAMPGAAPAAVPAFLSARAASAEAQDSDPGWSLEPLSPMAWRVRAAAATPRPEARPVQAPVPAAPAPSVPASAPHAAAQEAAREAGPAGASPSRPPGTSPAPRESDSGGYELPFAELRDSGWPDDDEGLDAEDSLSPQGGMPLPGRMEAASEPAPAAQGEDEPPLDDAAEQAVARELAHEGIDTDTDPVDIATQAMPLPEPAMPAVAPPSPPSVWRSARALAEQGPEDADLAGRGAFAARLRNQEADDDDDPDEEGAHASGEPGFMRAARRRAWWRRPAVRIALGLAGVLLLGVLLLQVGLQERDRLASQHPALRPLLQVLCAPLQCRIAPPRRIADVVIDSSSFNKARGDGYLLSLTIRSRADFPVAMPALELTLTDAQEQPILRRVLLPQDLSAPAALPANGEWGGAWPVNVGAAGNGRVAGYRLLAFYP
ncbi:DUF3426 domain-containing protein [Paracidovorax citrulli]|uniref:MJ0042 family finger-like protein n=3 Tax=Paracidovorax citrulli TaxID=80869 RepID=A1TKH0_PARC0|nr:DUF3426 domain-containing protein [Paracidovorax citrulli]ABM31458.1 MJ0042 family finger-like protein [Paracidovorax citrulli AAC00-1]PVY65645.1 putative Zn finger-like uncharacterized protein [Paracidovorax citrulli]QCX11378.1 hypothetical protein APS58_2560 [Paracidovorax citrulli]REG70183.1 putative Zn finger-like uncharacterized protein [Paracidovorax citrulli]RLJ94735.1 putative Zn finger-like uncharacterized protein [Paracidovorax citrulli]